MFKYDTVENISNIVTYNYYYGLFLTYVFPILLIILLIFIIVYLSSINKKLLMSFNTAVTKFISCFSLYSKTALGIPPIAKYKR